MTTEAMEITTFYLADGVTMNDFLTANADVDVWLQRQPGFNQSTVNWSVNTCRHRLPLNA